MDSIIDNKKEFWKYELKPLYYISILISSYDTKLKYIYECLSSIEKQIGNFGVELVWIDDGSYELNSTMLTKLLNNFKKGKKHFRIKYYKFENNMGISRCLQYGVNLCENELIFRMDSDDVMINNRILRQLLFMIENPDCVLCGTDIIPFVDTKDDRILYEADCNHPEILTYQEYLSSKHLWLLNHPTLCFKKNAVLEVGNYNPELKLPFEDLDLELRLLKKYGFLCNIKEELLLYRIHTEQITYHHRNNNYENDKLKRQLIERIIQS